MSAIRDLVAALRDPASVAALSGARWSALLSVARAEVLLGTLAHRTAAIALPPSVRATLDAARRAADQAQAAALWEAEMCRRALAPLGIEPILLKGTAYAAAGLPPAPGRQIGDLDILVPRERLEEAEAALLAAGWEWVGDDPYDQGYYRTHMHELPPLMHGVRDRMIDVHHTILPLTARPKPDAARLIESSKPLPFRGEVGVGSLQTDRALGTRSIAGHSAPGQGLRTLSPDDMLIHCAAHLFADGDLAGGLRNLWDFHLLRGSPEVDWNGALIRARGWGLDHTMTRAWRLSTHLFDPPSVAAAFRLTASDRLFLARLLARDSWGRETRPLLRLAFYIRSHLLRMPLPMLLRHLWIKWRKA